jgi:hypothetical protein
MLSVCRSMQTRDDHGADRNVDMLAGLGAELVLDLAPDVVAFLLDHAGAGRVQPSVLGIGWYRGLCR